ncbi:hypothetical protein OOK31_21180 [Streptomyces sp. NBC_00249]|uniref:hypothetical protein n=1 Tax=Streptomyces sp. NBC_00249 TaxID=2975690 RepID=UPI0022554460|nr:hypothetical protein [Streptomyces sp. NBC_00249]MCX5196379.1 hypothetical protein [Streptomyces sp. NBC_00249]
MSANPAHTNSPEPDGGYDPAGSTQMFRAFVEEAEPARAPSVPGARRRAKESGTKNSAPVALGIALALMIGAALWVVLH